MIQKKTKKSVINTLTSEQINKTYERVMMKVKKNSATGCSIVQLKPSKSKGYAQAFVQGTNKKVLVHILSYWFSHGPFDPSDGKDVSHLCHNPLCINPEHLIREDSLTNQRRKGCIRTVTCPCGCNHTFSVCHCPVPKCI